MRWTQANNVSFKEFHREKVAVNGAAERIELKNAPRVACIICREIVSVPTRLLFLSRAMPKRSLAAASWR